MSAATSCSPVAPSTSFGHSAAALRFPARYIDPCVSSATSSSSTIRHSTLPSRSLNVSVIGERPALDLSRLIEPSGRKEAAEPSATRKVWFDRWHETPVYWRDHLPLKIDLQGPAIIEQMDTTIVVDPGAKVSSDADGNLVIEVNK